MKFLSKAAFTGNEILKKSIALALCLAFSFSFPIFADESQPDGQGMAPVDGTDTPDAVVAIDSMSIAEPLVRTDMAADSTLVAAADSVPSPIGVKRIFNPDPNRALWLSVLCPGLGQIYNRRYWKVPIVVGGYVGLAYATSWNNRMLSDYTKAYRDIMDSDPNTKSYMDFYPSTTKEEDIDKTWLTKALKSKKDFYRRNRDLCIIGMVGLYAVCVIDAYVDASLSHFDISPDLSMSIYPSIEQSDTKPSFGVGCAFTF